MSKFIKIICATALLAAINVSAKDKPVSTNIQKVKPLPVNGIRINKGLSKYSLFDTTKDGFKNYVKQKRITSYSLKSLYNRIDNPKSIALSAYGYDYGYGRPDLAENFYREFDKGVTFEDKLRYSDFLLRTGRVDKMGEMLTKRECISNFKWSTKCYYYIGVADFLLTGDNRNVYINLARHGEPKAKQIYYKKEIK